MSNEIKDGGPAFPHEYKFGDGTADRSEGMSLRDYFAAKAMQGILSGSMANGCELRGGDGEVIASHAYYIADIMIRARGQS